MPVEVDSTKYDLNAGSDKSKDLNEMVLVASSHPYFIRHAPKKRPHEVEIHELIARADEYVTVSSEGIASLAKAIHNVLSAKEIEWVEQMIAMHNLKLHRILHGKHLQQTFDTGSSSQALGNPGPSPCVPHVTVSFYWWGFRIHMDHCFCKLITTFGSPAANAVNVIGAILAAAGLGGPWAALAAGIILLMVGWIVWADGYCTPNSGANYNQSWTVQGWITTVC
jgi:hypothetical protein